MNGLDNWSDHQLESNNSMLDLYVYGLITDLITVAVQSSWDKTYGVQSYLSLCLKRLKCFIILTAFFSSPFFLRVSLFSCNKSHQFCIIHLSDLWRAFCLCGLKMILTILHIFSDKIITWVQVTVLWCANSTGWQWMIWGGLTSNHRARLWTNHSNFCWQLE